MARVGTVTRPTVLQGKATWDYRDQGEDLCLIMVWEEDEFPTSLRGRAGETGKDQERKELRKFQPELRDTCTSMFIAALLTIARTWKQPRCPLADE